MERDDIMKKYNKIISILITIVLMFGLVACGNSGNEANPENEGIQNTENGEAATENTEIIKGRFIESQVKLPDGVNEIRAAAKLADGSLELVGNIGQAGTDCLLISTDEGESWQVKELESLNYSYISNVAVRNDGTVAYVGYFDEDGQSDSSNLSDTVGLKLVSKEGEIRNIDFTLPQYQEALGESSTIVQEISNEDENDTAGDEEEASEDENNTAGIEEEEGGEMTAVGNLVTQAAFDEDGSLIIQDLFSTFYKLNTETGELSEVYAGEEEQISYFGMAGNRVYAAAESGMKIFSSEDGSEAAADSVLDEVARKHAQGSAVPGYLPLIMTKGMEENSLVYANHQGVFYHLENGSVSEQLINGELCSLSDTTLALAGIVMISEKSYLISGMDSMGNAKVLKYVYDENASSVPEKQLKVYALEDSNLLRQAVANFQTTHQDTFVKVEIGISEENGVMAEDALRTLNTDILAGKGPDILILDGMPVESYIEKGILADIKGLLDEVEASDGLFSNIKNCYEKDGSIYCMPCRFKIPVISGSEEAVKTGSAEELLNYGKSVKEEGKKVFGINGANDILGELFQVESSGWISSEGTIDQSKLEGYLKTAKEMYDLDSDSEISLSEERYTYGASFGGYFLGSIASSSMERLLKESQIAFGTLANLYELKDLLSIEKQLGGTYDIFREEETKGFVPYLMAGIVSGKEGEQDVQEFLKTLFSKECGMQSESGFPVNKAAYQQICQKEIEKGENEGSSIAMCTEDGTMISYEHTPLTQKEIDGLTEKIESMTAPIITDRIIQELVMEEGSKYLTGDQSFEDTSAAIMQKVNLYLSE